MNLSVIIPAHNEEATIATTVETAIAVLDREGIEHEIVVVDDSSQDRTGGPEDLVAYYRLLAAGYDCAFGSRFIRGAKVTGYPLLKLALNRIVNNGIRVMFAHGYNDTTNAFKAYRREVIESAQPLLSHHFNLTVELPLKAIIRGHSYVITSINWRGRRAGKSKLQLQEMDSRYLFAFLEHHLSRGDHRRRSVETKGIAGARVGPVSSLAPVAAGALLLRPAPTIGIRS